MADKQIINLTSGTPVVADVVEFQVAAGGAGSSKKATFTAIKTLMSASPTLVTPDLGTPSAGNLQNCTGYPGGALTGLGTGVGNWLATPSSANLAAAVTDETGSGALVFATSPTLVTPNLGIPSAIDLTNGTLLPFQTRVVTGTSDTILATDKGAGVIYTAATAVACTLPNAVSFFTDGFIVTVKAAGAGTVTVASTTALIDGATTFSLPTGMSAYFVSKGGTWYAHYGKQGGGGGGGNVNTSVTLTGDMPVLGDGGSDVKVGLINLATMTTGAPLANERVVSGTSDTILAADNGKVVKFTNAGSVAVTLPQAGTTGFPAGFSYISLVAPGAGTVTTTPTTSTIGGAATLVQTAEQSAGVIADSTATNYDVTKGMASGGGSGANTALSNLSAVAINAALLPGTSDSIALGSTSKQWSDLFLGEGGVINWDSGDVTLTQTGDVLAVAGGDFRVATAGVGTNADTVPTLSSTNTFTNKTLGTGCVAFTLTTTGSSGAATYSSGTLNIPQYTSGGGGGTVVGLVIGCDPIWTSGTQLSISSGQLYIESTATVIAVAAQTITPSSPSNNTWYHGYVNSSGTFSVATTVPVAFATPCGSARSKTSDTASRYVGSFRTNGSGQFYQFACVNNVFRWVSNLSASPFRVLSAGNATSSTAVDCSAVVPVTSRMVLVLTQCDSASAGYLADGDTTVTTTLWAAYTPSGFVGGFVPTISTIPCNASQVINYVNGNGGGAHYIDVVGWALQR